jgi:hypothetical protein
VSHFKQFERKWHAIAVALISRAKTLRRGAWPPPNRYNGNTRSCNWPLASMPLSGDHQSLLGQQDSSFDLAVRRLEVKNLREPTYHLRIAGY